MKMPGAILLTKFLAYRQAKQDELSSLGYLYISKVAGKEYICNLETYLKIRKAI